MEWGIRKNMLLIAKPKWGEKKDMHLFHNIIHYHSGEGQCNYALAWMWWKSDPLSSPKVQSTWFKRNFSFCSTYPVSGLYLFLPLSCLFIVNSSQWILSTMPVAHVPCGTHLCTHTHTYKHMQMHTQWASGPTLMSGTPVALWHLPSVLAAKIFTIFCFPSYKFHSFFLSE